MFAFTHRPQSDTTRSILPMPRSAPGDAMDSAFDPAARTAARTSTCEPCARATYRSLLPTDAVLPAVLAYDQTSTLTIVSATAHASCAVVSSARRSSVPKPGIVRDSGARASPIQPRTEEHTSELH